MKKKQFSILCIGLILTACGQQNKNETTMDFTDDVQVALADGQAFSQMRVCHIPVAADEISFGIYACPPEVSSFTAIFSDMKITECAWKAHDGQQPDENM